MAAITATVSSIGGNTLHHARSRPSRSLLIISPIHSRRLNPLQLPVRLHLTTRPVSRRNLLVVATSLWDAITSSLTGGQNSAREAAVAVRRGMQLFVQGDVEQSVVEFDKAIELDPRQKIYLWQRGLSLYYLNRFEEGATQFRDDVAANPNDTEESIWCFLCEAQLHGVDEARRRFLEVGPDPRPVMSKAYLMFKNGGDPNEIIAEFSKGKDQDYFYAALYASLYHEAQKNPVAAEAAMIDACCSPYGLRSGDYMASLAKVHCKCRGWKIEGSSMT